MAKSSAAANQSGETAASNSGRTFKRPGSENAGTLSFVKPSKLTDSDINSVLVEGMYAGSIPNEMTGKNDFKFLTDDGNTVIINGAGNLEYRMKSIALNSVVQVIYKGKNLIKSGPRAGKSAHGFDVLVAE